MRATYTRTQGVRHPFPALDLGKDKMYGHIKKRKRCGDFLEFCRYLRSLYPPELRIAIICDNFSPHLTTRKDKRVGEWAEANNIEIAYTSTNSSWLDRIKAGRGRSSPHCASSPSTAPASASRASPTRVTSTPVSG
ncbi:hypothetical protein GCM10022419_106260 [Nonomuraea rosea]|uniref:Tc1-like transposase DDE domain-containing protein n=1 Tax=Nonomuraea rosea TaxID=638574 RepID=A0ABP6ZDI2_9ACTN